MGLLTLLSSDGGIITVLVYLFSIVLALSIHEFAHAWTADRLGDPTPRFDGRVTLNPLAHLDPIGTIAIVLVGFGWGKPVLYNPMRLRGKRDELMVALAGPASNLILAIILFSLSFLVVSLNADWIINPSIIMVAAMVNIYLAAFNMLPIPPLDGSAIIATFYPDYRSLVGGQIGFIVLMLLIFFPATGGGSLLSAIMDPVISVFLWITSLGGILL